MTTFWERAAHSVNHMFLFVILVVFHFSFEGVTVVLIVPVHGHCLPFIFYHFMFLLPGPSV